MVSRETGERRRGHQLNRSMSKETRLSPSPRIIAAAIRLAAIAFVLTLAYLRWQGETSRSLMVIESTQGALLTFITYMLLDARARRRSARDRN